jgi:hypothetical protein
MVRTHRADVFQKEGCVVVQWELSGRNTIMSNRAIPEKRTAGIKVVDFAGHPPESLPGA